MTLLSANGKATIFKSVGRCIYCGSTASPLTKEHVIPRCLQGNVTLPGASCRKCAQMTSEFERRFARDTHGPFRDYEGMIGRKKGEVARKHLVRKIGLNGMVTTDSVEARDHPALLLMPQFHSPIPPAVLNILERGLIPEPTLWGDVLNRDAVLKSQTGTRVGGVLYDHMNTLRVLAKIAHSFAVGDAGVYGFRPLLLDLIAGRCSDPNQFFGSLPSLAAVPTATLHDVRCERLEVNKTDNFLIVNLRLFAQYGAPGYRILVGALPRTLG